MDILTNIQELETLRDKYLTQERIARQKADNLAGAAAAINDFILVKKAQSDTAETLEEGTQCP